MFPRYVVARGMDNGSVTVWNITRGRCKGEAVSIERGLLEKNDIIVVKDVMVIVLSDRGISSAEEGSYPVRCVLLLFYICEVDLACKPHFYNELSSLSNMKQSHLR